jgi:glycosyltransferase involved in cell wall biosynthesis
VQPKVSIVWLNYNSAKFLDLALRSLKSLFELGYDNYEVIIVDNGSIGGSFEVIKGFAERLSLVVLGLGLLGVIGIGVILEE